jgi:heme-degrading monooxygenase HmoA
MPSPVVLINVFEVSGGMENEFVEWWKNCSEALKKEPGFIDAQLHRNLKSASRFQFINVAHWETEETFVQARTKNKEVLRANAAWKGNPAIYEVSLAY